MHIYAFKWLLLIITITIKHSNIGYQGENIKLTLKIELKYIFFLIVFCLSAM